MADNSNRNLPVAVGTAAGIILAGPALNKSRRAFVKFVNTTTGIRTVKLAQHTGGTTVADASLISPKDVPVPVADQIVFGNLLDDTMIVLRNGDSLSAAGDAAGLNAYVSWVDSDDQT